MTHSVDPFEKLGFWKKPLPIPSSPTNPTTATSFGDSTTVATKVLEGGRCHRSWFNHRLSNAMVLASASSKTSSSARERFVSRVIIDMRNALNLISRPLRISRRLTSSLILTAAVARQLTSTFTFQKYCSTLSVVSFLTI